MIAPNLKARRLARKWSVSQFMKLAGVSRRVIKRAEAGGHIEPPQARKLIAALDGTQEPPAHRPRGLAALPPQDVERIASLGGQANAAKRNTFTRETGQAAGRIGGVKISADREHMRVIGRRGGLARHGH